MKYTAALIFIILIISCRNQNSESKRNANNLKITDEDSSSIYSYNVSSWLDTIIKTTGREKQFILEERWVNDSIEKSPVIIDSFLIKNYASVLRWSPDSAHILDFGSYGAVPVADNSGKIHLEAGEPDTEVALISRKSNERIRYLFVGPSSDILDAKWLNNTEALIAGTFKSDKGQTDTLLWMVDINENLFRLYNVKTVIKK